MYKRLFLFLFSFFAAFTVNAQQYHHADKSLPCLNKKFSIVAHIVRDSFGVKTHEASEILQAIQHLNDYFKPICVSFEVCDFRVIDNFQYANLSGADDDKWDEIQIKFHADNRINMYFVASLGGNEAGFATFGGISDMTKGGIVISQLEAIPHEFGHFFGLLHTFEGNGTELVDGSNCLTEGDKICDTPADPYVPGDNIPYDPQKPVYYLDGCTFVNSKVDANGDYYLPDVGNIMSYYPKECACGFTRGQYEKMAQTYLNSNPKMW